MSDEIDRVFGAIARAEDNFSDRLDKLEARVAQRLSDAMGSARDLIHSQGIARDSTLRDAVSLLKQDGVRAEGRCTELRAKCSSVVKEIEQKALSNEARLANLEQWRNGNGQRVGVDTQLQILMAWKKNYWPKFLVALTLTFGGLLTFFLTFVEVSIK